MKNLLVLLTLFFGLTVSLLANGSSSDEIIAKIENKYKSITDFHATFRQDATVKALDKVQTAHGEVWLKKGGKMRWNYTRPGQDQIVSDGETLWYYYKDEELVVKSTLKEFGEDRNLISLLSDLSDLKNIYKIKISEQHLNESTNYLIDLIPIGSEDESLNKISLSINKDSLIIEKLYMYDAYGNLSLIKLNKIKVDNGIKDSVFKFKVPKGVEVVTPPKFTR